MTAPKCPQRVTALVCTRNRGDSVVRTVRSILASNHPCFEVIVVDQSTDGRTAGAVAPLLADARLRYLPTDTRGVSLARNLGLRAACTEIVVCTDDDCEVPPEWLATMQGVFRDRPRVALAFCDVDPAPHDAAGGFIPAYHCGRNTLLTTPQQKCRARGIGAGMAVRRATVLQVGGFDEALESCEDGDLAVRVLLAGHQIYETGDVSVLHHGYRTHGAGRASARRDWLGIGSAYAKPLRCGRWDFLPVPAYEFFALTLWPPLRDLLLLRRPRGLTRVAAFLRGFWQGWHTPIDVRTMCFASAGPADDPARAAP